MAVRIVSPCSVIPPIVGASGDAAEESARPRHPRSTHLSRTAGGAPPQPSCVPAGAGAQGHQLTVEPPLDHPAAIRRIVLRPDRQGTHQVAPDPRPPQSVPGLVIPVKLAGQRGVLPPPDPVRARVGPAVEYGVQPRSVRPME